MTAIHFHQISNSLSLFYTVSDQFEMITILKIMLETLTFEYGFTYITFFFKYCYSIEFMINDCNNV